MQILNAVAHFVMGPILLGSIKDEYAATLDEKEAACARSLAESRSILLGKISQSAMCVS
jgi:hypothetical protein